MAKDSRFPKMRRKFSKEEHKQSIWEAELMLVMLNKEKLNYNHLKIKYQHNKISNNLGYRKDNEIFTYSNNKLYKILSARKEECSNRN